MTGLNDIGYTVGFWANKAGANFGWYKHEGGKFHKVDFPGVPNSTPQMDQLPGVNDSGMVVGAYTTGSGSSAQTWGFTWMSGHFHKVNDPHGIGSTIINGINDRGELVGFYVDANNNNTDGFLAKP